MPNTKRTPTPAALPRVRQVVVDAVTDMLLSEQGMLRPPEKAAALLALIVELHKERRPFPPRGVAAKHIGASVATVDAALSTRIDEGYIKPELGTVEGNVQRRRSSIRERYYVPSQHLVNVVDNAKKRL